MKEEEDRGIRLKHSLQLRLMLVITGLIIFSIFACWSMNKMFLVDYYQSSKINLLKNVYRQINQIFGESGKTTDEATTIMDKLSANRNLTLILAQVNWYYQDNLSVAFPNSVYPAYLNRAQIDKISSRIIEFSQKDNSKILNRDKERLLSGDSYYINKLYDERLQSNYIELFGELDNGFFVYVSANFESMKESVDISNKFLSYIGIFVTAVSIFIMFFLSKSFTEPIKQLAGMARKMCGLDFRERYREERQDEIGELGYSINALSDKLEKTIKELKSANNELRKDNERKTQIDEMRKEFLSNVSHELKTPIALIQGYAEGLKENINEDAESRDFYCEVIIDEASKMNQMVKKLLSLNQIEFGTNQAQFEHFDITALIRNVIQSADILIRQSHATVILEQEEPIYVWADEYMTEEVVTNYFSNAIHHLDGERRIEIGFHKRGDVLRVTVFNTGEPIPEEELDKIWIKFYKVDKARTRAYGGSGIGLSIVKAIMEAMNRECGVENREDGVEFWFEADMKNE